jgi:hypothetical protein
MGALFPGARVVRKSDKLQGRFKMVVHGAVNGVSGAVYPVTYYLVEFDKWPGMRVAMLPKDLDFPM